MINISERQKTALLAGIIGIIIGILIGLNLPWYGSIEECKLREQKGMSEDEAYIVDNYCDLKFPVSVLAAEPATTEAVAAPEAPPAADAMASVPEPSQ